MFFEFFLTVVAAIWAVCSFSLAVYFAWLSKSPAFRTYVSKLGTMNVAIQIIIVILFGPAGVAMVAASVARATVEGSE